ncbi:MAG: selenocysteine lyase/cysteine desulfurase [Planctomycetota bacterium]|jgi:selenocysteine lyase/cysteine desulfurase
MTPREIDPHDDAFWNDVRTQFPLLYDRIYFNTSTMGISPHSVLDAVKTHMYELEKTGDSGHSMPLWQDVKDRVARLLNCSGDEIALTRNTTEGSNIVCNGLPLEAGDEIITSSHEHAGNTMAWLARQKRDQLVIKVFEPSIDDDETLARIEALCTPRTRALSVPHVSCASGQVLPVESIGQLAAQRELYYFVDGAQALGCVEVDLRAIGCHAYATSAHKWMLGPNGTGFLFVRQDALDLVQAQHVGAYSNEGAFSMETGEITLISTAQRYEYGTVNASLVVGIQAALQFIEDIGPHNILRHNQALADAFEQGLRALGAEVLTTACGAERSSIISFCLPGVPYQQLQSYLWGEHRLRLRGIYEGDLDALRASLHLYNSFIEVERALEAIAAAKKKYA